MKWVAIPFSRVSSWPKDWNQDSNTAGRFFTIWAITTSSSLGYTRFSSVQSRRTLKSHGLKHTRFPCLSETPRAYSNSHPSSQWCHPTISSSVIPFSRLQSFPASGSFPLSQFFASGGQSIGVSASASVLAMNIQDFRIDWLDLLAVQGTLSSNHSLKTNTAVQKYQFISAQLSL